MSSIIGGLPVKAVANAPPVGALSGAVSLAKKVLSEVMAIHLLRLIETQRNTSIGNADIVRHSHLVLDRIARSGEDDIQLLERAALGLDHEEVEDRDKGRVEDGIVDVGLVSNVGE